MQLRPYQLEVLNLAKKATVNQLYVLPTGAGKTVVFTEFIKFLLISGAKVLVLTHRSVLIDQINTYCEKSDNLLIITRQSYANKLNFDPTHIIIDECHSVNIESGQYKKILETHTNSIVFGFTATPIRENNGLIYGANKFWKKIDYELKPIDLIKQGYLVTYNWIVPFELTDHETLKSNFTEEEASEIMQKSYLLNLVWQSYERYKRNKTLIFAVDIKHAELLQEKILCSKIIHSKQSKKEQFCTLEKFKRDEIDTLINVNILTEGFDEPKVDTIILARPTRSIALHRQIIGRGLRLFDGKKDCLIVDLVSNFQRNGDISFNLKDKKQKVKEPYFVCPQCFFGDFISTKICPKCGYSEPKEILIRKQKEQTKITANEFKQFSCLLNNDHWLIIGRQIKEKNYKIELTLILQNNLGEKKEVIYNLYEHTNLEKTRLYHNLNILKKRNVVEELQEANLLYKICIIRNNEPIEVMS